MVKSTTNSGGNTIKKTPEELQQEFEDLKKKGISNLDTNERKRFLELAKQFSVTPKKSIDDLKKDLENAYNSGDLDAAEKISQEIEKLEQQPAPTVQKEPLDEIKAIVGGIRTKSEKKDQIMKLLEAYQKQREEKNKDLGKKPQDKMLESMYSKLLDYDKDLQQPDFKAGIDTTNVRSGLPFIPHLKPKANVDKKNGVISFSLAEVEILTWKARKRRNRINRVASTLNDIGNDSEKAIRYIFAMSNKRSGGRPGAFLKKSIRSWIDAKKLLARDPDKFMEQFKEQQTKFLDAITDGDETEEVKKTMETIKSWVDYHVKNYKIQQAQKWLN